MLTQITTLLIIFQLSFVKEISCCSCGCNSAPALPSLPALPARTYGNLGVSQCDDSVWDLIPSVDVEKPLSPPPLSLYKELGILPQAPCYPSPPKCGLGSWAPLLPRCLRKKIMPSFPICKTNLLAQKLALAKHRLMNPLYNMAPCAPPLPPPVLGGGCGCGCGL